MHKQTDSPNIDDLSGGSENVVALANSAVATARARHEQATKTPEQAAHTFAENAEQILNMATAAIIGGNESPRAN